MPSTRSPGRKFAAAAALLVGILEATSARSQVCGPVGPCGDIDQTGSVNTTDALKVLKKAVGQDQALTCSCTTMSGTTCQAALTECTTDLTVCTGDLGTCSGDLTDCTGDLGTCGGDLAECNSDFGACSGNLVECSGDLGDCSDDLAGCDGDLTSCEGDLVMCTADLSSTNADLQACESQPACGNGMIDEGEDCEAGLIQVGDTCATVGEFEGGQLRCGAGCNFDTSGCYLTRYVSISGTILDRETMLQWEVKDSQDNLGNSANIHDVDNLYRWSTSGTLADGSVFTDFLSKMNGSETGMGYAGQSDWRLPTQLELQSIAVNFPHCTESPCVKDEFLPNRSASYWTGATTFGAATNARVLNFVNGSATDGAKAGFTHVRAVRNYVNPGA